VTRRATFSPRVRVRTIIPFVIIGPNNNSYFRANDSRIPSSALRYKLVGLITITFCQNVPRRRRSTAAVHFFVFHGSILRRGLFRSAIKHDVRLRAMAAHARRKIKSVGVARRVRGGRLARRIENESHRSNASKITRTRARYVHRVVHPTSGLLHAQSAPFGLRARLRQSSFVSRGKESLRLARASTHRVLARLHPSRAPRSANDSSATTSRYPAATPRVCDRARARRRLVSLATFVSSRLVSIVSRVARRRRRASRARRTCTRTRRRSTFRCTESAASLARAAFDRAGVCGVVGVTARFEFFASSSSLPGVVVARRCQVSSLKTRHHDAGAAHSRARRWRRRRRRGRARRDARR